MKAATPSAANHPKVNQTASTNPIEQLIEELKSLRNDMIELEKRYFQSQVRLDSAHEQSARNLLHYLALRRRDLRQIQEQLAELGLSSLGRAESHVFATLEAVIGTLLRSSGQAGTSPQQPESPVIDFVE